MTKVPNIKLNDNTCMPIIGLGTYNEENEQVLVDAIKAAVKIGYRHFDCAYFYNNEHHIGRGLRESIAESNGKLKREDFFIVSKCWNTFHSRARTRECLDLILKRLDFDYLDLYLIHWPMGFQEGDDPNPLGDDGKIKQSDVHFIETYQVPAQ
jgi:aldehyde reductase